MNSGFDSLCINKPSLAPRLTPFDQQYKTALPTTTIGPGASHQNGGWQRYQLKVSTKGLLWRVTLQTLTFLLFAFVGVCKSGRLEQIALIANHPFAPALSLPAFFSAIFLHCLSDYMSIRGLLRQWAEQGGMSLAYCRVAWSANMGTQYNWRLVCRFMVLEPDGRQRFGKARYPGLLAKELQIQWQGES